MGTQTFEFENYVLKVDDKGFTLEDKEEVLLIDGSMLNSSWAVECMIPKNKYKTYITLNTNPTQIGDIVFGFGKLK